MLILNRVSKTYPNGVHALGGISLEVELGEGHHHIPLLVSSYACATYRGS